MKRLIAPFFIVLLTISCASTELLQEAETPEQKYWAALHIFDAYDEAALNIAKDPNTPVSVRLGLKNARNVAKEALVLADIAYNVLQDAKDDLDNSPDQTNLDKINSALNQFNISAERAFAQISKFKHAVDQFQE